MRPHHIGPNLTFQLFREWTLIDVSMSHWAIFDFSIVSRVDLLVFSFSIRTLCETFRPNGPKFPKPLIWVFLGGVHSFYPPLLEGGGSEISKGQ